MVNLKRPAAAALVLILCLAWLAGATPQAESKDPAGEILEELHYRVDVWILKDSIPAKVTFKRLASGRYRAEITGEAKGLLGLISGHWRGSYSTEMAFRDGKLAPLVYREESWSGKKHHLMEYRFDYEHNRVELYKPDKKKGLVKKWETPMKGAMHDGISFYYNQRLGLMGMGSEGEVFNFPSIPYPKPEEITLRMGPVTPEGRRVMVSLKNPALEKERSEVYAILDGDGVPTQVWTWVLRFGKISGTLLSGGKRLDKELLAARTAPGALADKGP